jgi:hypothetical protein
MLRAISDVFTVELGTLVEIDAFARWYSNSGDDDMV